MRSTLACARLDRARVGNPGLLIALIAVTLVFATSVAIAQGPTGTQPRAPRTLLGTGFTYQGLLKQSGSPVNALCDFKFGLYDALTGPTQIGTTQTTSVPVTNGYFTISDLDFGSGAFNGDARWLDIQVRCPIGNGNYTPLAPRQPLTPAPMALALPGLYTQQNATSPNLIGGYSGNTVSSGVEGGTISGGGNSATNCGPTGAQPCLNKVTAVYGTIGGGLGNTASNQYATVGGGYINTAGNWNATVSGGQGNTASGGEATVGGGINNIASGDAATIGGGWSNHAISNSVTIGGGQNNFANGDHATIGGGGNNSASNWYATVSGGDRNNASGDHATVPGGYLANASHYGEMAYASGQFAVNGDAQTSLYVLRNTTTNAVPTELFLNGSNARITIATGQTVAYDVLVVARRSSSTQSAGYSIRGVIGDGTLGGQVKEVLGEDDMFWDANVEVGYTALVVTVTGLPGETIRWVATVRTVTVSY